MSASRVASRQARTAAGLTLLLAAGCVCMKSAPPATAPAPTPGVEQPVAGIPEPGPAAAEAMEPRAASSAPTLVQPVHPPAPTAAPQPAESQVAGSTAAVTPVTVAKSQPSAAATPARPPAPTPATVSKAAPAPAPAPKTASKAAPAPVAARPATPPLDLKSLETRLRDTKAVGVFTKLSLKNQVDDLLIQFRAYHKSQTPALAALRQSYNLLMLKVLTLLQDGDPALARDIVASREAIWGILADPKKFTDSNLMAGVLP